MTTYRYSEPNYVELFEADSLPAALAYGQNLLDSGDYEPSTDEAYVAYAIVVDTTDPEGEPHYLERIIEGEGRQRAWNKNSPGTR